MSDIIYAKFREDKEAEPGYTRELIGLAVNEEMLKHTTVEELDWYEKDGQTITQVLRNTVKRIPNNDFLGKRMGDHYEWTTWKQGLDMVESLGLAFEEKNLCPEIDAEGKKYRTHGIISGNRMEWPITHLANNDNCITTIPLYKTLGIEAIKHAISLTKIKTISLTSKWTLKFMDWKINDETGDLATLKNLICFDPITDEEREKAEKAGISLFAYAELIKLGEEKKAEGKKKVSRTPDRNTVTMLCFTSGTTGMPKGVKITHKMQLSGLKQHNYLEDNVDTEHNAFGKMPIYSENDC